MMGTNIVRHRLPGIERQSIGQRRNDQYDAVAEAQDSVLSTLNNVEPKRHRNEQWQQYAGLGVGLTSVLAENLLSHPCIVLRRQCQVHHNSEWYHVTPFTLFHVLYNIQRNQTPTTLWKGIGSTFTVKGIYLVSEAAISEFTPFPKEVNRHSSLKKLCGHVALKGLSFVVTTPFFAASLVETVQSEIASERPGAFECVKEGFQRLCGIGVPHTTRLLPVWKLVLPTVAYCLSHYIIKSVAQFTMLSAVRVDDDLISPDEPPPPKSIYERYFAELLASFTGGLLADMTLFPLETILHRLHVQGTRTIIDNTDSGLGVVPINTRYDGFFDCLRQILTEEGFFGLFKGFGALVLQYTFHVALLKLTSVILEQIMERMQSPVPPQRHPIQE